VAVRSASDLEPAFATAARQRAGAIAQVAAPLFDSERPRMVALAARYRLPTIYYARAWVEAGGLMSYGPDLRLIFRRAAVYVDRILKGANPADLPVERPTKFDLVINLKTAKVLGVTFPQSVLVRTDEVIE
jgi:putative ABC transport system substrate-binding protein